MAKGNDDIVILADCAESALIVRQSVANSRRFIRLDGGMLRLAR